MKNIFLVFLLALFAACNADTSPLIPAPSATSSITPKAPSVFDGARAAAIAHRKMIADIRAAAAKRPKSAVIPKATLVADLYKSQQAAKTATPGMFGAAPSTYFPKSLSVTDWYTDDQNVTGLASDNNDCQTPTTPCATFNEIVYHRWGTTTPVLGGALANDGGIAFEVIVHVLSAWSNNTSDSVVIQPAGGFLSIEGPIGTVNQVGSPGTLANVISKNAASDQVLTATLAAGFAPGQLIHNTTHNSYAWTSYNSSGNVWLISQPLDPNTLTEVDTWANGDAYTIYRPINVNVNRLYGTNTAEVVFVSINSALSGSGATAFGANSFFSSLELPLGFPDIATILECIGCDIPQTTVWNGGAWVLEAGQYRGTNNIQGDMQLSDDFLSMGLNVIPRSYSILGKVWIQNNAGFGGMIVVGPVSVSNYIAGNSTIQLEVGADLLYGTSGMTATQLFLNTGATPPLQFNHVIGTTVGNSTFTAGNTVTICGGIPLNVTNIDKAASATCATTGFGGNALNPAGGGITSF